METKNKKETLSDTVSRKLEDMITTQMIDGRKCLVIPVEENVEINGLRATVGFAGTMTPAGVTAV